jgi:hypothetical protein
METYLLYLFGPNGRFLSREVISAHDDEDAIAKAERRWDDRDMELWRQGTQVRAFRKSAKA